MIEREQSEDVKSLMPDEIEKFTNSIFQIPNFNSQLYKKNICDVFKKVEELDNFTEQLESKVDRLLYAQQQQFVNSYTSHMRKIKTEFKRFEQEMLKQQETIKYYQNEGKMSNLIKKVNILEEESKKLYSVISKKQKEIKILNLENKVQLQENKRLTNQIKEMLRDKNKIQNPQIHLNTEKNIKSEDFFTTEVNEDRSLRQQLSRTTDQKGKLVSNLSHNSVLCVDNSIDGQGSSLKKKIHQLEQKNKKLALINTKVIENRTQFQNLFLDAVTQIKKQIKLRKKINYCSYEDFKKEDKLSLLVTIISNEELLRIVYEKLFANQYSSAAKKQVSNPQTFQKGLFSSTSVYMAHYNKYKEKQTRSIHLSENPEKPQSNSIQIGFSRNKRTNFKRGRTEDISVLPYI